MLTEIILVLIVLYLFYRLVTPRRPPNFPPGPKEVPLAGGAYIISQLDESFPRAMGKLGEIYGPVTGIYLGQTRAVIINGYEAVKEVLSREEFQGRPEIYLNTFANGGRRLGIMFTDGEFWKDQRRFTLRHLRDFGFGKASMEDLIAEEIQQFIASTKKKILENEDGVIPLQNAFGPPIINVLWAIIAGQRYSHDDPEFREILAKLDRLFRSGNPSGSLLDDWPILRFLPGFSSKWKDLFDGRYAMMDMLDKQIDEHITTRDPSHSRDFMDLYLKEIDKAKEKGGLTEYYFRDQLKCLCADLFSAGAESTSNSVAFAMLYMILYPEVQNKVQQELDSVVGRDRLPTYNDKANLPYTEAVLSELMRLTGIAPSTVPHCTLEDTKLYGYDIPKNTFVLVMLDSVHKEKSFWDDPEEFRPERFLESSGRYVKSERLLPFGQGKRVCPGEVLARTNYFNFFTAMLHTFKLELAPGKPTPSKKAKEGFTIAPQPFEAKVTLRL